MMAKRYECYFAKRAAPYVCSRLRLFEQRATKTYPLHGILSRFLVLLMRPAAHALSARDSICRRP
jgi:hypothetical protein